MLDMDSNADVLAEEARRGPTKVGAHCHKGWLTGRSVASPTDINPGATLKWQPQIGPPRLWKSPEENPTVSYGVILVGVRVPLC